MHLKIYNAADAIDTLRSMPHSTLCKLCVDSHLDIYNLPGYHMESRTIAELISWWLAVYQWDQLHQKWQRTDTIQEYTEFNDE